MNRQEALSFLKENLDNKNLLKHCYAVEAGMKSLAKHFGQNEEDWALAGLLHDIDYATTYNKPEQHAKIGADMCRTKNINLEICDAIESHNEMNGSKFKNLMGKALYCTDPLTGLIVATALVIPTKKLADINTENILRRMKEKSFAKGANREAIRKSQDLLGLNLETFVSIVLSSMKKISDELGL